MFFKILLWALTIFHASNNVTTCYFKLKFQYHKLQCLIKQHHLYDCTYNSLFINGTRCCFYDKLSIETCVVYLICHCNVNQNCLNTFKNVNTFHYPGWEYTITSCCI